jgi:hypothetical protein
VETEFAVEAKDHGYTHLLLGLFVSNRHGF